MGMTRIPLGRVGRSARAALAATAVLTGSAISASAASHASGGSTVEAATGCPIRVEFAPGTDHATVTGSITDGVCDRYALRLGAGQTMTLTNIGALHVNVTAPDGATLPGGPGDTISYELPANGDYVVEIGPGMGEQDAYSITITVAAEDSTPTDQSQRLRFAPGTDRLMVVGAIAPGTTARYVLAAAAGQSMFVEIGPSEFAALTTIFGPDGAVVGAGHTTATAALPADGDYTIEVGNTGSTTDFTLTVRIPAAGGAAPPTLPATL